MADTGFHLDANGNAFLNGSLIGRVVGNKVYDRHGSLVGSFSGKNIFDARGTLVATHHEQGVQWNASGKFIDLGRRVSIDAAAAIVLID